MFVHWIKRDETVVQKLLYWKKLIFPISLRLFAPRRNYFANFHRLFSPLWLTTATRK